MKKSVNEMLNAMKVNPIEAEKVYYQKCKRWTPADFGAFWYEAMKNYPEDGVKETANRLIDYLYENDLLDYEYIAEDYVEMYKSSPYMDVSLREHVLNFISTFYDESLDEAIMNEYEGAEELLDAVDEVKGVWYWDRLLKYCVEQKDREYEFAYRVAMAF